MSSRIGTDIRHLSLVACLLLMAGDSLAGSLPKGDDPEGAGQRQPNILLIVADDLGYNDISLNGNPLVSTPHIDSIAHGGVRFVAGYSSAATCSPARAALMTGRFQQRFGLESVRTPDAFLRAVDGTHPMDDEVELFPDVERSPETDVGLPHSERSLATLLQEVGYRTGLFGKWHLGSGRSHWPQTHGFDEFVGIPGGAMLFSAPGDPNTVDARLPWSGIDNHLWDVLPFRLVVNEEFITPEGYMTDILTDHTVDFIERHKDGPFFAFLSYTAPHNPLDAPRDIYDRLDHIEDHKTRVYYAMVESMDENIGRVLAALERNGLTDDTIVIFTSDNGGAHYTRIPWHNLPYRGWKITFFEGGINVPYLIRWPGKIPPGQSLAGPASGIDVLPTVVAATGATLPDDRVIDGVDLLPLLIDGDSDLARALDARPLFWKSGGITVLRKDSWKLHLQERPPRQWLFDLSQDPTEQINLAELRPDKVETLRVALDDMLAEMAEPMWPAPFRMRIRIGPKVDEQDEAQSEFVWSN